MKIFSITPQQKTYSVSFASAPQRSMALRPLKADVVSFSSKSQVTDRERFAVLKRQISDKMERGYAANALAGWNFYVNQSDENKQEFQNQERAFLELFKDEKEYEQFKSIDSTVLSAREKEQLRYFIKQYEECLHCGAQIMEIQRKSQDVSQKYTLFPRVTGKAADFGDAVRTLFTEKDTELRRHAYAVLLQADDAVAEDIRDLVRVSNEVAVTRGYPNYYAYMLSEKYDVDSEDLQELLDDIYKKAKPLMKKNLTERERKLKEIFGVDKLENHHYRFPIGGPLSQNFGHDFKTKEDVLVAAKMIYEGMGFDIDKFIDSGKLTLDLFPRAGKSGMAFSVPIVFGEDVRILANLDNKGLGLKLLNHELGHAVYNLGIPVEKSFLDKSVRFGIHEAIAFIMEELANIEPESQELKIEALASRLARIEFEKEMYENPDQDLKELWKEKLLKFNCMGEEIEADNSWAINQHFIITPAYMQNYFRAAIMKEQIQKALTKELGNYAENPRTAEYLRENLFKYGASLTENELVEKLTGKKLSVDDYVESLG